MPRELEEPGRGSRAGGLYRLNSWFIYDWCWGVSVREQNYLRLAGSWR